VRKTCSKVQSLSFPFCQFIKSYKIEAGWPSGMQDSEWEDLPFKSLAITDVKTAGGTDISRSLLFQLKKDGMLFDFHAKTAKSSGETPTPTKLLRAQ
jgi:hypothetical protein